jgi:hypothetical protein
MEERETLNKSIKVSERTYKKLNDYKIMNEEIFNSVIKRMFEELEVKK